MSQAVGTDISEKVVVVTGASGGIGSVLVRRALDAGAKVVGFDVAEQTISDPKLMSVRGDVSDEASCRGCIERAVTQFGGIDALVNNAGIVGAGRVEDMELSEWTRVLGTNLTGAFLFAKHAIPHLVASRGSIVNVSSTNGLTGGSALSGAAYACSKSGLIALTRHLASSLASSGVRVNCVAPGPVDTEMLARLGPDGIEELRRTIPSGELVTADGVADLTFFLISDAARHLTGTTIPISGGLVM